MHKALSFVHAVTLDNMHTYEKGWVNGTSQNYSGLTIQGLETSLAETPICPLTGHVNYPESGARIKQVPSCGALCISGSPDIPYSVDLGLIATNGGPCRKSK